MPVAPLGTMKLRTAELPNTLGVSFGKVRNWNAAQHAFTKFHQGWDLESAVGTPCRAIADGVSGNASGTAPHLHIEIRNTSRPNPGLGGVGRVDPAEILGYHHLVSS